MSRISSILCFFGFVIGTVSTQIAVAANEYVLQSEREIPVMASVDVVVVGGSAAGVAAAESAAAAGARVFLVAPRPYLGEDLCATLRLVRDGKSPATTEIERRLFGDKAAATPAHVKATLAETLLEAEVPFTLASYATDVLCDEAGRLCGVVIANRAGRQAISARVVIDATSQAGVCRLAGCRFQPWAGGPVSFERVVLHADKKSPGGFRREKREIVIEMPDLSYGSFAEAEQIARDRTFSSGLVGASETLFYVPPVAIACRPTEEDSTDDAPISLDRFRPRGREHLYVLSGWADIPRQAAARLLQPGAMIGVGQRIGRRAAQDARRLIAPRDPHAPGRPTEFAIETDVQELLAGPRPINNALPTIRAEETALPVMADVDVVVVGGGTAGAPAAIAAARRGLGVLVVEYQYGLGGVGTLGFIGKPYHGKKMGFSNEVPFPGNVEDKMEWYRTEIRKAGGTIWFGALGCGAVVDEETVRGVVVATPQGRGVVSSKVVIDATGSADVAISAGADYMYGDIERGDIALQGTGLPSPQPGSFYVNSDYLLVDESDIVDVHRALVSVQLRRASRYNVGTMIQTRERRRVVGDFLMRYVDQIAGRTYPDSIVLSGSDYDSHGYPSSPFFALLPHDAKSRKANHPAPGGACFTPYRCLLPKGLDGILVAGLGISMDRDASAMVRMQLDMANQGYAAGTAAAMAVEAKVPPRGIRVRRLQRHLVDIGSLPEAVLSHEDSFPLAEEDIHKAVLDFGRATNPSSAGRPLAIILTHPDVALPMLREAHEESDGQARLLYAEVLAVFGERDVVPELVAALNAVEAWDAKIFQGHMADYAHLPTPIDSIILALGHSKDHRATPSILRMLDRLDAEVTLSHHRAVALALEDLRDPAAAEPLARLLQKPGMRGYAMSTLLTEGPVERRTESLREITLARTLYRCGDHAGLGRRILEAYADDLRGLFARHAAAVLAE